MKLEIAGNTPVNRYYAQTLCLLFFPGAKFPPDEEVTPQTPRVTLRVDYDEPTRSLTGTASISVGDRTEFATHVTAADDCGRTFERNAKIAAGAAFFDAGKAMFKEAPPWGMLTGVRPSKIATELLTSGLDSRAIKEALKSEYYVNPKKAALVTDVAFNEYAIIKAIGDESRLCSVYVSIPFCPTRCSYCSFISYATPRLLSLMPDYLVRLCSDISRMFGEIAKLGFTVQTVYIGGGTPTTLNAAQLDTLLGAINEATDTSKLREFTLEAGRPDTIDADKLRTARRRGVTRISINPQTLSDELLREIGRRHTVADFYRAFGEARDCGPFTVNTDLIAGLPGDGFANFSQTVDEVLELEPDDVTFHTFCVKRAADLAQAEGEIFSRGGGDTGKCVDYAQLKARHAGYSPYYIYRQKNTIGNYENVGYARPGREGLYNIFIMEEIHSIFAVGAGAVTKLISPKYRGELCGFNRVRTMPAADRSGQAMLRLFMPKYPYEYLNMTKDGKLDAFFAQLENFFAVNG